MSNVSALLWTAGVIVSFALPAHSQEAPSRVAASRARTAAMNAAEQVLREARPLLPAQIFLAVDGGLEQREVEAGFLEVLLRSGVVPHLERGAGEPEAALFVRMSTEGDGVWMCDVRIEKGRARTVLYARQVEASDEEEDAFAKVLVPVVLVASAVLVIYLLFTVRS